MDREERIRKLRQMLNQVTPTSSLESASPAFESLRTDAPDDAVAAEGLRKLSHNESIDDDHRDALEAIVLPRFRPVLDIVNGSFAVPPPPWRSLGDDAARAAIERAIPSVGRIELPNNPQLPYGGTGFVVGDGVLMTNRHVAELFASGLGDRVEFRTGQTAEIDFKREIQPDPKPVSIRIEKVLMIHPFWDMALLKVRGLPPGNPPLKLSVEQPERLTEKDVAVLGYPAQDFRNDLDLQNRIFRGVYNVKRMTPGKLKARRRIDSFGNKVNAFTHDASTLGGNSGSMVLDVASGMVVALHFAGIYLDANFAVPAYELARDSRVVDAGVAFSGKAEPPGEWMGVWTRVVKDVAEVEESKPRTSGGGVGDGNASPNRSSAAGFATPVNVNSGGSISFTVPLHITVTLGEPSFAPVVSAPAAPAAEALFGRRAAYVPSPHQSEFDAASLTAPPSWRTHLSLALASHLAYADADTVEATGSGEWKLRTCEFIAANSTNCFIASTDDAVLVCFRGTADLANWLTNLNVISTTRPYGTVHRGFYHAFRDAAGFLEQRLEDFGNRPVFITGHSLGGALATIAAAEWRVRFQVSSVHTYGQPAVGTSNFRSFMAGSYPDNFHRFVNDDDIVPRVPPGYVHVGKLYRFGPSGELPAGFESLGEAAPAAAAEPKVLSEPEFESLKASLRATRSPVPAVNNEAAAAHLEGFFPSFSDHRMDNYIDKILKHV